MKPLRLATISAAALALSSAAFGMANPAAVFCEEQGGKHVIVQEADGERGICELPDGSKVDAWDYFRENWEKTSSGN